MGSQKGTAREVLNRLKWSPEGGGLGDVDVIIRHRGAPGDEKRIPASTITDLGKGSFQTPESTIPYHRVLRITRGEAVLYRRISAGKEADGTVGSED